MANQLALIGVVALILLVGCTGKPASAHAPDPARQTVAVAAAADLRFALDDIVTEFQKTHGDIQVQVSYGSSGNLYSQLVQRAPFDVFLSADTAYPNRLIDAGLGSAEGKFVYAVGRIVLWAPTNSTIDLAGLGIESLRQPSVRRIAVANPEHAPYGKAAVAALQKLGVYDAVQPRLVFAENVAQAAQFVSSGAADLGIISASLAGAPPMRNRGRSWTIPLDAYPRMEQAGMILSRARHPRAARELRAFILAPAGQTILRHHGFSMAEE